MKRLNFKYLRIFVAGGNCLYHITREHFASLNCRFKRKCLSLGVDEGVGENFLMRFDRGKGRAVKCYFSQGKSI